MRELDLEFGVGEQRRSMSRERGSTTSHSIILDHARSYSIVTGVPGRAHPRWSGPTRHLGFLRFTLGGFVTTSSLGAISGSDRMGRGLSG